MMCVHKNVQGYLGAVEINRLHRIVIMARILSVVVMSFLQTKEGWFYVCKKKKKINKRRGRTMYYV